jgi:hypothetical protein
MSSLFSFWNLGSTKRVGRDSTDHVSKEGESLLNQDQEQDESLRVHPMVAKRSTHLIIWIIIAVTSALVTFYVGFLLGSARREGPWGSFERGFVEERVVSKY